MNKQDELTGTFVLVHPNLIHDPEGRQNQIGVISTAELENDNVMVSFGKDGQGLFSADALLVLRKQNDIHFDALRDAKHLDTADFKKILQVMTLANSVWVKDRRQAMEICRDNPTVLQYGMASLEEKLGLRQENTFSR